MSEGTSNARIGADGAIKAVDLGQNVDLSSKNRRFWLVRVPSYLIKEWTEDAEDGQELGEVTITTRKTGNAAIDAKAGPEIRVDLRNGPSGRPSGLKMNLMKEDADGRVFSVTPGEEGSTKRAADCQAVSMEGVVDHRGILTPARVEAYRSTAAKRTIQMNDRTVTQKHESRGVEYGWKAPTANPIGSRRALKNEEKRHRAGKQELLDMLFGAFKKREAWSRQELLDYTEQPAIWLREVLQEIADYKTLGDYRGKWVLKEHLAAAQAVDDEDQADDGGAGSAGGVKVEEPPAKKLKSWNN